MHRNFMRENRETLLYARTANYGGTVGALYVGITRNRVNFISCDKALACDP